MCACMWEREREKGCERVREEKERKRERHTLVEYWVVSQLASPQEQARES